MKSPLRDRLAQAFETLLTPLVRLLLRHGVPFSAFAEIGRKVYVDVARRHFAVEGRKTSDSRVALITGLTRKEVKRLRELERVEAEPLVARYDRSTRLVAAWRREPRFHDADGRPAPLDVDREFSELVREFSADVPVRAVLDEFTASGLAEVDEDRRVHLVERAYVPRASEEEGLRILGRDVSDLVRTIDHNLTSRDDEAFFQRKVEYDHLPAEYIDELRREVSARAQELLEEFDRRMAAHDLDEQRQHDDRAEIERHRAMVGIYFFAEPFDPDSEDTGNGAPDETQNDENES